MTTKSQERRFVVASAFSQGDEWLDQLLAIQPLRTELVTTQHGEREATFARVIEVTDDGPVDHGERAIWWSVVRGQLRQATPASPWVAGRLVKLGNAYRLDSLTPEEEVRIAEALTTVDDQ